MQEHKLTSGFHLPTILKRIGWAVIQEKLNIEEVE
jgi:hypothetical protein